MVNSPLAQLLLHLDSVAMERRSASSFLVLTPTPDWFSGLFSAAPNGGQELVVASSPFLSHFLTDAEEFWHTGQSGRLRSGPWTESAPVGEKRFEASAVCVRSSCLLIVEALDESFNDDFSVLQKARETSLAYEAATKQLQCVRSTLLSVSYDMASCLSGLEAFLAALNPHRLTDNEKHFLEIGRRRTQRMRELIDELASKHITDPQ